MFFEARGKPGGQKGQTNIWFALWLWGRNTSQADSQGIQNQTEALGVFIQKLARSSNLSSKLWFNKLQFKKKKFLNKMFLQYFSPVRIPLFLRHST